uniref:Secreted protein n=1 Tax=Scophthalmus maximus TaxID=52904 RepID=A0A8D3A5B6_SCOMX
LVFITNLSPLCCLVLITGCANAEQRESVGGAGFLLPLVQHVCLVCSQATQESYQTQVCCGRQVRGRQWCAAAFQQSARHSLAPRVNLTGCWFLYG